VNSLVFARVDLPFDQIIVHQIAGDLLPGPDGAEVYPAGLIATTFLSNGVWYCGDADKEKIVSDMVDDRIDTVGKAFLGLTLGCARCHDHKFDPVSQPDYSALAGIFYSTHIFGMRSETPSHPRLLDRLAARFVDDGWSLKKLHRRIMLSFGSQPRPTDRKPIRPLWRFKITTRQARRDRTAESTPQARPRDR
jgi:hypothetical protein